MLTGIVECASASTYPIEFTMAVDYVSQVHDSGRLAWEPPHEAFPVEEGVKVVGRNLGTKYHGWRYEEEVRAFPSRDEVDEETGLYFTPFGERLTLREVIAGVRYPFTRKVIDDALKRYTEEVRITKARMFLDRYEIIVDGPDGFSESQWPSPSTHSVPEAAAHAGPTNRIIRRTLPLALHLKQVRPVGRVWSSTGKMVGSASVEAAGRACEKRFCQVGSAPGSVSV